MGRDASAPLRLWFRASALAAAFGMAACDGGTIGPPEDDAMEDDDTAADDDLSDDDLACDDDMMSDDDASADDDATPPTTGESARATDAPSGSEVSGLDVRIGPDGAVYVSWVDERDGAPRIRVARSRDGGATFEPSVPASPASYDPMVAMARKPYLAADGRRVAVVSTDRGLDAVVVSASDIETDLDFAVIGEVDPGDGVFADFARGVFGPNGEVWVAWQSWDAAGRRWIAYTHEYDLFEPAEADEMVPGQPCECCPIDVLITQATLDLVVAYRGNDDGVREQWAVVNHACGLDFTDAAQVSHTGWTSDVCPMEGPRLAERQDGGVLAAWADPTAGEWRVWIAASTDPGAAWEGDHPAWDQGGAQSEPRLAVGADGTVWLALIADGGWALAGSADGGATFPEPHPVETPAGRLSSLELASAAGRTFVAGIAEDGTGWTVPLGTDSGP